MKSLTVVLCLLIYLAGVSGGVNDTSLDSTPAATKLLAWTEWTPCTSTCRQNRTRICVAVEGEGQATSISSCQRVEERNCTCPTPKSEGTPTTTRNESLSPSLSTWGPWSICSTTCGGGRRKRNRINGTEWEEESCSDSPTCESTTVTDFSSPLRIISRTNMTVPPRLEVDVAKTKKLLLYCVHHLGVTKSLVWQRDDGRPLVHHRAQVPVLSRRLRIHPLTMADAGVYRCRHMSGSAPVEESVITLILRNSSAKPTIRTNTPSTRLLTTTTAAAATTTTTTATKRTTTTVRRSPTTPTPASTASTASTTATTERISTSSSPTISTSSAAAEVSLAATDAIREATTTSFSKTPIIIIVPSLHNLPSGESFGIEDFASSGVNPSESGWILPVAVTLGSALLVCILIVSVRLYVVRKKPVKSSEDNPYRRAEPNDNFDSLPSSPSKSKLAYRLKLKVEGGTPAVATSPAAPEGGVVVYGSLGVRNSALIPGGDKATRPQSYVDTFGHVREESPPPPPPSPPTEEKRVSPEGHCGDDDDGKENEEGKDKGENDVVVDVSFVDAEGQPEERQPEERKPEGPQKEDEIPSRVASVYADLDVSALQLGLPRPVPAETTDYAEISFVTAKKKNPPKEETE